MNVLLITFSFPPAGGVGVLRALSLAKYLPENGVRLDVLTARNAPSVGKDLSLLAQVPAAVTVHRCWTLDLPFALRKAIKRRVAGRAPEGGTGAAAGQTIERATGQATQRGPEAVAPKKGGHPLKRILGDLLLPDPQVGWLPFAFPAAKRLIRQRKIDVVLITVPPFSSVLLVRRLRKVFADLPIVLDFRDEWLSTTINLVSFNKSERARDVAREAEAEAVRDASLVVTVTEAAQRELMGRYPTEAREKFRTIPNGFDTAAGGGGDQESRGMPEGTRSGEVGKVLLTYIGTVYGSTDPGSFVDAVLGLPEWARERLRVRFIGHIETAAYRESLLRLGQRIELKGFMPQAEALRSIAQTDYLLLITHDRINVAAKFYDYLGGGKPILAAVHPEGDVRKLLEETRTGKWADVRDPASIRAMLLAALSAGTTSEEPALGADRAKVASFHRRALTARYADLLRSIVKDSTGSMSVRNSR